MKKFFYPAAFIVLGTLTGSVCAHLAAGSLLPTGGGTYNAGTRMAIHWVIEQEHSGNYLISYSPSAGVWVNIISGIRNTGARFDQPMDTAWMIPAGQAPTTTGRIRVWQSSPEPGNANAADTSNLYTLVSGNFTITNGTPIRFKANEPAPQGWNLPSRVLIATVDGRLISRDIRAPRAAIRIGGY